MTYTIQKHCRACGGALAEVIDLGDNYTMTGSFPRTLAEERQEYGPLRLVQCVNFDCQLVQLSASYDLTEMYGDNYGYRSGLNQSMVVHLGWIRTRAESHVTLGVGDVVVDIGSNDGTLLNGYTNRVERLGFDPTIKKFGHLYDDRIIKIPDFFRPADFFTYGLSKAKIVTSIACFYDLPDPQKFVDGVAAILHGDGVWVFEQSYLVSMLRQNAFDTICHEHLEYYHLRPIKRMLDRAGLVIRDVSLNDTNGGSILITAAKSGPESPLVAAFLAMEAGYLDGAFAEFELRMTDACERLRGELLRRAQEGQLVIGLGASTKGNVLLQRAGISPNLLPAIAEVNPDKFGCRTPGTGIPIIPEADARLMAPDAYLVLPWHFRKGFEAKFNYEGAPDLIFPLPTLEVVRGRR